MDQHKPALDWTRSKQARASPVPVGAGESRLVPVPSGSVAAERSQETLYVGLRIFNGHLKKIKNPTWAKFGSNLKSWILIQLKSESNFLS